MTKKKLKVEGMHCSSCAMNIDFDLEDMEAVKSAKTNYVREICEVEYEESKINLSDIIMRIRETGYQAMLKSD